VKKNIVLLLEGARPNMKEKVRVFFPKTNYVESTQIC